LTSQAAAGIMASGKPHSEALIMAKDKKKTSSVTAAAKTLGARGGKVGGPARARALTAGKRSQIASLGGKAAKKKK
jgi:hypothetical protein